jgi:diaminopimelate decarboxylase
MTDFDKIFIPNGHIVNELLDLYGSPFSITNLDHIKYRINLFKNAFSKNTKIFYALKANYNPGVLKKMKECGLDGVDAVSYNEVLMAKKCGFSSDKIIFTGNNSTTEEMINVNKEGILLNIGSMSELQNFAKSCPNTDISIRINPDIGDGECDSIITGGANSKFGIRLSNVEDVMMVASRYNMNIVGVHCHIGSGFYEVSKFKKAVEIISNAAKSFKNIKFVDFGGGFGVRYDIDTKPIDLSDFYNAISGNIEDLSKHFNREIEIRFEPGKFLVAESTCLLTKVTSIRDDNDSILVGVNSGMNHIIRPALYGAKHPIVNLSNQSDKKIKAKIVGNICESTDVISHECYISDPREGDIIAILVTGAYCPSMMMNYNLRSYPTEILLDDHDVILSRKSLNLDEMINGMGFIGF